MLFKQPSSIPVTERWVSVILIIPTQISWPVSLLCFWPEEFFKRKARSESLVVTAIADWRTKQKRNIPPFPHEAPNWSVCPIRWVLHRPKTNDLYTEMLEPVACQQHGHSMMLYNVPRGEIQYSCNHSQFVETQLRLLGSMRVAVCVTCISRNTSKQAKTLCWCNCFRRCPVLPCSVQHDKSLYDKNTVETCTVKREICIENMVSRTSNDHLHYIKIRISTQGPVQTRDVIYFQLMVFTGFHTVQ